MLITTMQNWRSKSMLKEPLIYLAVALVIGFIIFVALALWWPIP